MKQRLYLFSGLVMIILAACSPANKLTKAEQKEGWQLLFDGKTTNNWRGAYQTEFPKHGWIVEDGTLKGQLSKGTESGDAGDIVSLKKYKNFELVFDWKLGKGGNSGVKYFIEERQPRTAGSQAGYEYQLIDDANYIYNGKRLPENIKTASLYEIIAAEKSDTKMDAWHSSKIVVNNNNIQHWLDGKKVVDVERTSDRFQKGFSQSKFKNYSGFTTITEGHILLQDHGHNVAFKNIKIKEL